MRDSPRRAVKSVFAANQKKRIAIKQEMAERIERQEAEDAIEQERRNDLIRQIRAIEPCLLKAKVGVDFFFFFYRSLLKANSHV